MSDATAAASTRFRQTTRERILDLAMTLPFIVWFLIQLAHHLMWRDEVNAFGLAAASPNLSMLFHYIHYEGHPWLWYLLLWLVSRITLLPAGMQCLQALIGTGIYLVIGLWSPFQRSEKLLLFLCYFISFEYTVITRMYGLLLLLALLYVRRRMLRPAGVFGNALLLGLMACTDLTGMVVSFALALEYAWAALQEARGRGSLSAMAEGRPALLPNEHRAARLAGALALYAGLGLSAVLSLLPSRDISKSSTTDLMTHATSLKQLGRVTVSYLVKPYFPAFTGKPDHFWNPAASGHPLLYGISVPLILLIYWWTLRRRSSALLLVGTIAFLMICMGQFVYYGSIRHFGMTFVGFLLALWLLRSAGDQIRWPAYVLLALTALGGLQIAYGAWQRPFSQEEPAAKWVLAHHLENGPLVSYVGMGVWLQRPVYMPQCNCTRKFLLFERGSDYKGFNLQQMENAARYSNGQTFTYMVVEPLTPGQIAEMRQHGLEAKPLAAFTGSEVDYEDMYLYAVSPAR